MLTTPADPSSVHEAVERRCGRRASRPAELRYVVHGTTVATNAIIEGKIARGGFVTTEGFRDLLEIARQVRPSLYDLQFEKPTPLVPRYRCFDVPSGSTRGRGADAARRGRGARGGAILRREEVDSVAVCLLHAYSTRITSGGPARSCRGAARASISLSSEVAPEFREYVRASTTVINAAIRPVVARYLEQIESRLPTRASGPSCW